MIMHKLNFPVTNNEGSIILMVLMIMALLSLVGTTAINNSNTELLRAKNDLVYQQNFYLAEGAAMQAVEELENSEDPQNDPPDWLDTGSEELEEVEGNVSKYWENNDVTIPQSAVVNGNGNTFYLGISKGIAPGSSLAMHRSKLYQYTISGLSGNKQTAIIAISYRKPF